MLTVTRRPRAVSKSPRLHTAFQDHVKDRSELEGGYEFGGKYNADDSIFLYGDEFFISDSDAGFFASPNFNPDVSAEEHNANIKTVIHDVQDIEKDLDAALDRAVDPNHYGAYFETFEEALEAVIEWHALEDTRTIPKCYFPPIESEMKKRG